MSTKTHLVLAGVMLLTGAGIGSCTAMGEDHDGGAASSAVPAPVKTETVIEYKNRKVGVVPTSCMNVLKALKDVRSSEEDLINVFTRGTDVMGDGHEALASHDGSALNEAREKLYKLDTESNDSAQKLSLDLWPDLESNLTNCKKTDAYKGGK